MDQLIAPHNTIPARQSVKNLSSLLEETVDNSSSLHEQPVNNPSSLHQQRVNVPTQHTSLATSNTAPHDFFSRPPEVVLNIFESLPPRLVLSMVKESRNVWNLYKTHNKALWKSWAYKYPDSAGNLHFKFATWVKGQYEMGHDVCSEESLNLPIFYHAPPLDPNEDEEEDGSEGQDTNSAENEEQEEIKFTNEEDDVIDSDFEGDIEDKDEDDDDDEDEDHTEVLNQDLRRLRSINKIRKYGLKNTYSAFDRKLLNRSKLFKFALMLEGGEREPQYLAAGLDPYDEFWLMLELVADNLVEEWDTRGIRYENYNSNVDDLDAEILRQGLDWVAEQYTTMELGIQ